MFSINIGNFYCFVDGVVGSFLLVGRFLCGLVGFGVKCIVGVGCGGDDVII